jgi:hypothetical protein
MVVLSSILSSEEINILEVGETHAAHWLQIRTWICCTSCAQVVKWISIYIQSTTSHFLASKRSSSSSSFFALSFCVTYASTFYVWYQEIVHNILLDLPIQISCALHWEWIVKFSICYYSFYIIIILWLSRASLI